MEAYDKLMSGKSYKEVAKDTEFSKKYVAKNKNAKFKKNGREGARRWKIKLL